MAQKVINLVSIPEFPTTILESHLINCIDIGGTCNCTCSSCVYKGKCRCPKCRCNAYTIVETLVTELYEEEPNNYKIG